MACSVLCGHDVGTLTIGLGLFAVVYTAVQKILIDPMPYRNPGDLYYVWRDYRNFEPFAISASGSRRNRRRGAAETKFRHRGRRGPSAILRRRHFRRARRRRSDGDRRDPGVAELLRSPWRRTCPRPRVCARRDRQGARTGHRVDARLVGSHRRGSRHRRRDVRLQGRPFTVIGVCAPDFTFVRK